MSLLADAEANLLRSTAALAVSPAGAMIAASSQEQMKLKGEAS